MTEVERLLADLNDPDWLIRANAAEALGKLAGLPQWQQASRIGFQHLTKALMLALNFTPEELELNRRGQFSQIQRLRLRNLGGRDYIMRGLWFGLVTSVGGFSAPYVYLFWSQVVGVLLGVLVVILSPLTLVWMARSTMDEAQLRKWGSAMVVTNTILGVLAVATFMVFGHMFMSSPDTTQESITSVMLFLAGAVLILPGLHFLRYGWRKPMFVAEGYVEVVPEGPEHTPAKWFGGLTLMGGPSVLDVGFLSNAGVFIALQLRKMLGYRPRNSREANKFVLSYSIKIGRRRFYTTKEVGRSFVDGAYYRIYCARAYPAPMMIAGEAVEPPPVTTP